jgi:hypothetical protein
MSFKNFTKLSQVAMHRWCMVSLLVVSVCVGASAQLTGTKTVPGTYATLALALTDLNTQGVGAGGVIINVAAGYTESAPAGGFTITAAGTAANPILIQKAGGANPVLSASAANVVGSQNDAVIKLIGASYVTLNGLTIQENVANTVTAGATNTMAEWGVALLYASATQGAQNNTIQNCTISLNRAGVNSFAIYSNTNHTAADPFTAANITVPSGSNSNNKFYGNTISNANFAIMLSGSISTTAGLQDIGNDVGGTSSATGNTITNCGSTGTTTSAYIGFNGLNNFLIHSISQNNDNISYNSITSAPGTSVAGLFMGGILKTYPVTQPVSTISTINNNTITITNTPASAATGAVVGISSGGLTANAASTISISNNNLLNLSLAGAFATTNQISAISNGSAPGTLNINNNVIRGLNTTATSGAVFGISNSGAVVNITNINNNQLGNATGGVVTYTNAAIQSCQFVGITNTAGATTDSLTISGNDFRGVVHTAVGTGLNTYITNTSSMRSQTITNNTFTNLNINTTGSVTFIANSVTVPLNGVQTIANNNVVTAFNKTGSGGSITFSTSGASSALGAIINHTNNNFSNMTFTGATTISGWISSDGGTAAKNYTGNTFSNITGGTGTITIMSVNFGGTGAGNTLANNTISNITGQSNITCMNVGASATTSSITSNIISNITSTGVGGTVIGIIGSTPTTTISLNTVGGMSTTGAAGVTGISVSGTTANVFKNKVSNLSASNASGTVSGIAVTGGTTTTVYNNIVGDLRTTAANASNPLNGLNITGGTNVNAYYNTVMLNGSSTGSLFGSSALFASTSTTLTLRNNIFINNSAPSGLGLSVAYNRSTATLASYTAASNNNNFYASTIYTDGVTPLVTLAAYKTAMATRDAASVTENTYFLSTVGSNANFLHVDAGIPNQVEGNGVNIATFTDDFDMQARQGNAGYVGTGIGPDIGADEFEGVRAVPCSGTPASANILGANAVCNGLGTTLTLSNIYVDLGISFQWAYSLTSGGPYTNLAGIGNTQATGSMTAPRYYKCTITCANGGATFVTAEKAITVNALPNVTVSPVSSFVCTPGGTPNALTASGALTYTWSPAAGLSAAVGTTVNAYPTATTTYVATGTDANGCVSTGNAIVAVFNYPTGVTATAAPATICSGTTTTLNATGSVPGGVTTYAFAGTSSTYTAITGTTLGAASIGDDVGVGNLPIGFTFNYNGTPFTVFAARSNGLVELGNTTAAPTGFSFNTLAGTANCIAPFWDDNNTTGGSIIYATTGTAPNRILTVQWTGMHVAGGGSATNPTLDVQAILYETTGTIQFVYGGTSAALSSPTASIGISGTTIGGFLSVTPGATPATSTVSSTTENGSVAVSPVSGSVFTFTPPAPTFSWTPAALVASPTAASTLTTALTGNTTYTVVASNSGCMVSATALVTVSSGVAIATQPSAVSKCVGQSATIALVATGAGISYQWRKGGVNIPVGTNASAITASLVIPTTVAGDAGSYDCVVSSTCGSPVTSSAVALTVNGLPTVAVSPAASNYCAPGTGLSLTASGGATYTWTPTATLSATTGAVVLASPAASTVSATAAATYTVVGTDANGCTNSAVSVVTVYPAMTAIATATPASICSGANSQLLATGTQANPSLASAYTFTAATSGGTLFPMTGGTQVLNPSNDDTPTAAPAAIGFTFNYEGIGYTQYSVSPDGWILLGGATAVSSFTNSMTLTSNTPKIAAYWDDLATGTDGNDSTVVIGTAPNRIFVNQWKVTIPRLTTGASTSVIQACLYEADGKIEFRYGDMGTQTTGSASAGLVGAGALSFNSITFSSNTASGLTANDANAGTPTTGTIYTFTPPAAVPFNYTWTSPFTANPTTPDYIPSGQTIIKNPLATGVVSTIIYRVAIRGAGGCTGFALDTVTAVPLVAGAMVTGGGSACAGLQTVRVNPTGGGVPYTYSWKEDGVAYPGTTATVSTRAGSHVYTCTIGDACANSTTTSLTVVTVAQPTIATAATASFYCVPGGTAAGLSATGGTTYSWTPASSLSSPVGAAVSASPTSTTTYTVVGTNASGCTSTATTMVTVGSGVNLTASAAPATLCTGQSTVLSSVGTFKVNPTIKISEVNVNFNGTGGGTYPAYVTQFSDLVEIQNVSSLPVDISGYQVQDYASASAVVGHPGFAFPSGTILPAGGVAVVQFGTGVDDVANRYYNTGGATDSYFSSSAMGVVLKNGGAVVDAVGLSSSFTFDPATGVTAGDWSGFAPQVAGLAGVIRTGATDSNTGADWVGASTTTTLTIGVANAGYTAPAPATLTYSWSPTATIVGSSTGATATTTALSAPITYTVVATSSIGCSASATTAISVQSNPSITTQPAVTLVKCEGDSAVFMVAAAGPSLTYQWRKGGVVIGTATGASYTARTLLPGDSGNYDVVVSAACGSPVTSTPTVLTVNAKPAISVSPATATYCTPGTGVSVTASGSSVSYAWTPSAGLSATTGVTVVASPASTQSFVVTGTDANGCKNTATAAITVSPAITSTTATATPTAACSGSNVALASTAIQSYDNSAARYSFAATAGTFTPITGGTVITTLGDDTGTPNLPIGFDFSFNGTTHTVFSVSSNGTVQLGGATGLYPFTNILSSTLTYYNALAPFWDDNNSTGATIQYLTTGTAPNRVLTVQWVGLHIAGGGSATNPTLDMQAIINETTGVISYVYGPTSAALSSPTASIGLVGGTTGNFLSVTPGAAASVSNTVENSTIAAAPAVGTTYTFTPPPPPAYNYAWSPATFLGATANTQNPTATAVTTGTTYVVTVTSLGCSGTASVVVGVNNPTAVTTQPAASTSVCAGAPVTLTGAGTGSGALTYQWKKGGVVVPGATTATLNFAATTLANAGSYTLDITGACGTVTSNAAVVAINAAPTAVITGTTAVCTGSTLTLNAGTSTAGSGTISSYAWSAGNGSTTATAFYFSVSTPTTYTVTITNSNGCSATATASSTINTLPVAAITGAASVCAGGTTTLSAGAGFTSYAWSNGTSLQTLTTGTAATYTVTVTNANGCTATASQTVIINANPAVTVAGASSFCAGSSTTIDAGTGYTSYSWSNGASTQTISASAAGTYTVTVTLSGGCSGSGSKVVTVNALPTTAVTGAASFCAGASSILDAGAGFTSYAWSNSTSAQTATVTAAGTYTVTVTNAAGCTTTANRTVSVNALPSPTVAGTAVVCAGSSSTLDAGAGYSSYAWSSGATSQTLSASAAGTYTVTVTNAAGCSATASKVVTISALPTTAIIGTAAFCAGSTATLNGGSGFSSYAWSNGANGQIQIVSTGGTYTVTVTNAAGCTGSASRAITANPLPTPAITGANICQGSATTIDAGTGYASYSWNTGAATQTLSVTAASTYTVTVTSAAGCSASATRVVTVGTLPTTTVTGNASFCSGSSTTLDAGAGFASYAWSNAATTQTSTVTAAGTYTVTITNANGCTATASKVVTLNANPVANITGAASFCAGANTVLDAGTGFTSYAWTGGAATQTLSVTAAGTYAVTVTNALGCTAVASRGIVVNALPVTAISGASSFCTGSSAILTADAGFSSYAWTGGSTTQSTTVTAAGTYTVTVTNALGCSNTATRVMTVNPLPVLSLASLNTSYCKDAATFTLAGTPTGGTFRVDGNVSTTFAPGSLSVGSHPVEYTFTDANACTAVLTRNVTVNALPVATLTGLPAFIRVNSPNAALAGTPTGGTYSGRGMVGNVFNPSVAGVGLDTVTYSYTDPTTGCIGRSTIIFTVNVASVGVNNINQIENRLISMFPNPTLDELNIDYQAEAATPATVSVLDVVGQVLMQEKFTLTLGNGRLTLNVGKLPAGTYLIQTSLDNSGKVEVRKLVKM